MTWLYLCTQLAIKKVTVMDFNQVHLEPDWGFDFDKNPQFEIRFVEIRDDSLYVLGVAHSSIKLRDKFNKLVCFPAQANTQDTLGEKLLKVSLKVRVITAYHNRLNRINASMNAALELSGNWDGLLEMLESIGWSTDTLNSHQWQDDVTLNEKLILTR